MNIHHPSHVHCSFPVTKYDVWAVCLWIITLVDKNIFWVIEWLSHWGRISDELMKIRSWDVLFGELDWSSKCLELGVNDVWSHFEVTAWWLQEGLFTETLTKEHSQEFFIMFPSQRLQPAQVDQFGFEQMRVQCADALKPRECLVCKCVCDVSHPADLIRIHRRVYPLNFVPMKDTAGTFILQSSSG